MNFNPKTLMREKIADFKTMNPKRVERRAEGRILVTAPLLVTLYGYGNAVLYGKDSSNWRLGMVGSCVLLTMALKKWGGERGMLWGAWIWLLSFSQTCLVFGSLFSAVNVWMMLTSKDPLYQSTAAFLYLGVTALAALLGYYGKKRLEQIEIGER